MRASHSLISAPLFAFLILLSCGAGAAPIHFNLILNVTDVDEGPACAEPQHFGCGNAPGDVFVGSFDVDSSLLAMPGLKSGDVTNFLLQIGNVVWDQNNPSPLSDFAGFINAAGQFFQTSFDIDVLGGTIIGLQGGVHASADLPSIDFNVIPGGFQAAEFPGDTGLMGTLQVVRVLEPPVLALFFVSIAPFIWVQFRRRVRAWGRRLTSHEPERPRELRFCALIAVFLGAPLWRAVGVCFRARLKHVRFATHATPFWSLIPISSGRASARPNQGSQAPLGVCARSGALNQGGTALTSI